MPSPATRPGEASRVAGNPLPGGDQRGEAFPEVLLPVGDAVHRFGGRLQQAPGVPARAAAEKAAATRSHKSPIVAGSAPTRQAWTRP